MLGKADTAASDRFLYNSLWLLDHVLGPSRVDRVLARPRRAVGERLARSLRERGPGELDPLPRRRDLSPEVFRKEHVATNEPVILEGAARDWPCCARWTPESLAERFGDVEVGLINTSVSELQDPDYRPTTVWKPLREAVADLLAGGKAYPRFLPLLHERPELQDEFDHRWLARMRDKPCFQTMFQMFLGAAGSDTAMHCAMPNNLFVQVHGRKVWYVYPPSYNAALRPLLRRSSYFLSRADARAPESPSHPEFAHVRGWTAELQPGDVLYVPPYFWHQVQNPTVSLGVAYRWLGVRSIARSSLTQSLLTLLATNPPIWVTRQNKADFTRTFARAR